VLEIGVFDPYLWSNKAPMDWIDTDFHDIEQALTKWTELCAAHPDKCSLAARGNNTAAGIRKAITHTFDAAYQNYDGTIWNPTLDGSNSTIVSNPKRWTYTLAAQQMVLGLYDERLGSFISDIINDIINEQSNINGMVAPQKRAPASSISLKRSSLYTPLAWSGYGIFPTNMLSMGIHAIACSDTIDSQGTSEQFFKNIIKAAQNTSPNFVSTVPQLNIRTFCHRWTSKAVERLPKKMNVKPKNVVLVIGNTEDPVTPFVSAKSLASSAHLGNKARLVKHNALGHGTCKSLSFLFVTQLLTHFFFQCQDVSKFS
jgi:hypothetical protein